MSRSELDRRSRQFLVHCYLYYQFDEPLIEDPEFDRLCRDLQSLLAEHPDADSPHRALVESALGAEASGHTIRRYPPEVVSAAAHLLYQERYRERMGFEDFLAWRGHRVADQA